MEPQWGGGTKLCSNGPGHMTKMAAMPIYGKNMKNSSSLEPKADDFESFCAALCTQYNPGFTLTSFMARSNLVPYGKKLKQWIFQKLSWSMI